MSFIMTKDQIRNRTKTVTRRQGWLMLKSGDLLMAVEKSQGLKRGEKVVKLGAIRVTSVRRELIRHIDAVDCIREGFPTLTPAQFVAMYCLANGCQAEDVCTRIEFEYVDESTTTNPRSGEEGGNGDA